MIEPFPLNALCLFFKSEQFQLIDMPVQVGGSVDKHGHIRKPHTRIQKVRVEPPKVAEQPSLFGDAPAAPSKKASKLDAFIRKHGGLESLVNILRGMTDAQRQRLFAEMGKLDGKSAADVEAMFAGVKPAKLPQDDLFSQPAPKDENVTQAKETITQKPRQQEAKTDAVNQKNEWNAKQAHLEMGREEFVDAATKHYQAQCDERGKVAFFGSGDNSKHIFQLKARLAWDESNKTPAAASAVVAVKPHEATKPEPKLSTLAKQAIDILREGGYFRKQLETQYRGGEKFETRLCYSNGSIVTGYGFKTKQELQDAGMLERVPDVLKTSAYREEWRLRGEAKPAALPVAKPPEEPTNNPKEGDHKTENGIDYVLRGGRWHLANEQAKHYRYALPMRPPAIGAVPKGFVSHTQDPSVPVARHGVLAYDRELTPAEVKQYELVPLGTDGAELQLPKLPAAVRSQVEEAMSNLRYMADEIKAGNVPLADYKDDISEAKGKLETFAVYANRKGIDKDKVLDELGGVPDFSELTQKIVEKVQKEPAREAETQNSASLPFGVQPGISKQARRDLNAQAVDIINRGGIITEADKAVLRQYSGNGGCGDSLNEFYTLPAVADAMWQVAQSLGVSGAVLEPSCGPGVFLHTAPAGSKVSGVELDPISAKIARALHGDRHEVANASLERFATQDDRQFDAVLGNVPFGLRGSLIKDDKPDIKTADGYFCDTALDKCRAGGIVGLIVPTGIMDSKTNRKLRENMLRKGQFLGAQRMPNTAFEHSHTEVTTDMVWFRKYPDDVAGALSTDAITQSHLQAMGVWDDEFLSGSYFTGRGAENVLGIMGAGWRAKAGMGADITVEGSMRDVPAAIAAFKPEAGTPIPAVTDILAAVGDDEKTRQKVLGGAMTRPYADKSKPGDTKTVDGIAYVLQGKPPRWHRIDEVVVSKALTTGQELAGRIDALMSGVDVDRPKLEADLKLWVLANGLPSKHKDILLGAQQDKSLYRLIGAVNGAGELSDAVAGRAAKVQQGNFEATVQSLLNDHETAAVRNIAQSAGMDDDEATDHLYGSGKYAIDPATGEWTTKDIYLSGDLWKKADAVRQAMTGELVPELRKKLEQQAAMLNEAIAPVSLEEAFIQVNSAFLPTTMLSAFLTWKNHDAPDANKWTKELPDTVVTFADGVYTIEGGSSWGENKHLDKFLNRTGLKKDDKHIIDDLNVEFKEWLCASSFREQAEDLYNRSFKGFKDRQFSNEPMDIPGMNTEGLKDYQWGGLRWALNTGKGIIAADVGLGKTARGLMLAATLKNTGQAKRPMIVVPKSVLANWAEECKKWFPASKVLLIGQDGDGPNERKRKYHDMQQNDYYFIIISEPSFEEIDLDPVTKGEYNSRDFWVQRGEKLGNAGDKRTNQIKTAWNQARAGQEFDSNDRTNATYFNELGVDCIIADEMHHQKNLVSVKSRFGESPKYLGGGGQSMRSLDFNLKSRWLLDQNNGRNVFGLTATPTKNSPIEIFAMLSHVAPEAFERVGIRNSEEFLDRFARFEDGMALDTGGTMEEALITAGFQNMDELRAIMRRYINRTTAADVGLKLPERQDVQHLIDMDAAQQGKYAELRELAANAGGKDATGDNHIFSIMDKMNKTATDMSLLDPSYDATKAPKYVACAKEILANLKDGGQIVFSDYVDSHEKIAAALVKSGIPRNQIGIINAQAAKSTEARQKICNAFNAGKLKVVIGNTTVMGEGLNLQKGTSDIHHLDLPWEPASMQQRNGRGLRQGNTNKGVRIHSYLSKGSFDGYRLQAIMAKKDWQDAIWNGGNEVENLNKKDVNRDELMIMLAADPDQARAAFEANHAAKEERLTAGKTAEAAQRFVQFQEVKRSFNALKNKDTQSAARLKAKMDKEYSALKADKYFTAKEALDMDAVIVANTGVLLHSGAGIVLADGAESEKWVVTGVDPRNGAVSMRRYGDETGKGKQVMAAKDLPKPKAFTFNEAAEKDEIRRKIAEKPIDVVSIDDLKGIPSDILKSNNEAIQKQIWEKTKSYSMSHRGDQIPLIEKATGKTIFVKNYEVSGKTSGNIGPDTHDFMLPTDENKALAIQGWMDAERAMKFSSESSKSRNSKYSTVPTKKYGTLERSNPWGFVLESLFGDQKYYHSSTSPIIKAAKQQFQAEQSVRIKKAPSFQAALEEAAPLGDIESGDGEKTHVKFPKRVLAQLWAKARHEGVLTHQIDDYVPRSIPEYSRTFVNKHMPYLVAGHHGTVHGALLKMAAKAGYHDLVHAMVESSLRHRSTRDHKDALQVIAAPYSHGPDHLKAMQKLAEAQGIMDTERGVLPYDHPFKPTGYGASRDSFVTVRDYLANMGKA